MKNNEVNNNEIDNKSSYIKLGLWLLFILILFVILKVGGINEDINKPNDNNNNINESENNSNNDNEISYIDKLNKLNDNYHYNYVVLVNGINYTYSGNLNKDEEIGTKTFLNNTLNYYKNNGYTYEVIEGNLQEITNLYENIDSNLLNVSYIKNLISYQNYTKEDNIYKYNIGTYKIDITTDTDNITNINIIIDNDYYNLEFREINEINDITY